MNTKCSGYLLVISMICLFGCKPTLPPSTPGGGFIITTSFWPLNGVYHYVGGITVRGTWVKDFDFTTTGDPQTWNVVTGDGTLSPLGYAAVNHARAPATWRVYWLAGGPSICPPAFNNGDERVIARDRIEDVLCYEVPVPLGARLDVSAGQALTPQTLYSQALPGIVRVLGNGFSTQYGMPVIQYYDPNGTLVAQTTATTVLNSGVMQGPSPDVSQAETGTYFGVISNVMSTGALSPISAATVNVVSSPGYMSFNLGSSAECGTQLPRFTNFTYFDSFGRVSVLPIVLGAISCTQYSDGPAIYTDQFGHTLSVTTSDASLWINGTWQTVPLQLVGPGLTPGLPFGSFDTPANNATGLSGAINVTGWALDPIQATGVSIFREPVANEPAGLVYIGEANFVAGARPDVASLYSNYPYNDRAGWGMQILTNMLPDSNGDGGLGSGTYKLHAIAYDAAGFQIDFGQHTIQVNNLIPGPFGTIDTPTQGGTVLGTAYVNFGWTVTPANLVPPGQNAPCIVPTNGSTLSVWIDGRVTYPNQQLLPRPTYNNYRSDIATLFPYPTYLNGNGAVGYIYLDTTQFANGVHTIAWGVTDSCGTGAGLGSRYFTVQN